MFKIDISQIAKTSGASMDIYLEGKPDYVVVQGQSAKYRSPVKIEGKIINDNGLFILTGKLETVILLRCSRCAEFIDYGLSFPIQEFFAHEDKKVDDELEDEVIKFEGHVIDLSEVIERNIILEVPMKVLCKETCKGLCSICGMNLNYNTCNCKHEENIDSRMLGLKKWQN